MQAPAPITYDQAQQMIELLQAYMQQAAPAVAPVVIDKRVQQKRTAQQLLFKHCPTIQYFIPKNMLA